MQKIRNEVNTIIDQLDLEILENEDESVDQKRRRCPRSNRSVSKNKNIEALEVCDSCIQHIGAEFTFTGHLCDNIYVKMRS